MNSKIIHFNFKPSQLLEVLQLHPSRTGVDPPDAPLLSPRSRRRLWVPQCSNELGIDLLEATHYVSRRKGTRGPLQERCQFVEHRNLGQKIPASSLQVIEVEALCALRGFRPVCVLVYLKRGLVKTN